MIFRHLKNKGFTLIELLVVISIISMLSSVVFAATSPVRKRSQLLKFRTELIELNKSVTLYRLQNGGNWPTTMNSGNIFALAQEMYDKGLRDSAVLYIPPWVSGIYLVPGAKSSIGGDIGCDDPEAWKETEYATYFALTDPTLHGKVGEKYHGGSLYVGYGCREFR